MASEIRALKDREYNERERAGREQTKRASMRDDSGYERTKVETMSVYIYLRWFTDCQDLSNPNLAQQHQWP